MRHSTSIAKATLAVLVTACASHSFAETQLRAEWYNNPCPLGLPQTQQETPQKLAPFVAAIASVIVPKLVAGGVDLAAKKLQAAGADRPNNLSTKTEDYFYTYNIKRRNQPTSNCLILVEAENFDSKGADFGATDWRRYASRVGNYQAPRMIFMAAVQAAPEGKLFRLVPAYLEINEWRERSFWRNDRRDYNIAVTLSAIGQSSHFASLSLSFKGLQLKDSQPKGQWTLVRDERMMNEAASDYVPLAPVSDEGTKFINSVETAWATKDRAASILDENQKWLKAEADKRAGTAPLPMPDQYKSPYLDALDGYCGAVQAANKSLDKDKRVVPAMCSFRLDQKLKDVTDAKLALERTEEWLNWAAVTCWPAKGERDDALANPDPDGVLCARPTMPKVLEKPHTRVAGLIVVTEVIPGSKAAKFLGDALAASSADVSKVIVDKLPPLTQQAREAAAAADRTLAQAVVDADYKVQIAEDELAELPTDAPKSKVNAARMKRQAARYAANAAYRANGQSPRYPENDV